MERWDEKKMREQWAVNEANDDFMRRVQAWGHDKYKESFALAEQVCKSYERQTETMTEVQRYDFRRAFELGYRFAMLKHDPSNAPRQPEPAAGDRLDADVGTEIRKDG